MKLCRKGLHDLTLPGAVIERERNRCTECRRSKNRRWRLNNIEHVRESNRKNCRAWRLRNPGLAVRRHRFSAAKSKAKYKGLLWTLTEEQHIEFLKKPCDYCGGPLPETQIGLDRVDNQKGYELGNVVPCCTKCNFIKGKLEGAGFRYPRTVELMRELIQLKTAEEV